MFQNYFKTAIRSILRERYYTVIKIAGLALGLGTSLVLFLYVSHQLSYDKLHPDVDRLYRINQTNIWSPDGGVIGSTGPVVASIIAHEYPEVEQVLRINTPGDFMIRYVKPSGDVQALYERKILAADSNFFSFFAFSLKEGDPHTALIGKNKVILSDQAAQRLFGDEPALGKIIQFGDDRTAVEVTGVTHAQPSNIHFHFDYLFSIYTNPNVKKFEWSFIWTQVVTYIKLKPGADAGKLDKKLRTIADLYAPATFKRLGMDYDEFKKEKGAWDFFLQPVLDVHLYSQRIGNRLGLTGDIKYVYTFSVVGIFILLIAVVNFINLSTARGIKRAKEVGVKKTLGLMRRSLIVQFQVEHIMLTTIAMLLGLGVMELLRLFIQPLTGIELPLSVWGNGTFIVIVLLAPVVIGFLAGLYPSFYLTSFRPAQVLKGKLTSGLHTSGLRNVLVVFQFTISIALMVATVIVFQQLRFFQSKNLGFDKENILMINYADKLGKQLESFREEIAQYPGVVNASVSMDIRTMLEDLFMREGDGMQLPISQFKIDEHFFETTKLSLSSGRTFDVTRPSDKEAVIINETTAKLFGWTPEQALGKRILYLGDDVGPQEVIGVVKDFHFQALRQTIAPIMFFNINSNMWGDKRIVIVKFNTKELPQLLASIERRWNAVADATPFDFSFYDQELKMHYQGEQRLASLFSLFTGLSITIAVIGLIGLVAYSAEQRKKEIGIRKVFGASLMRIYIMMNSQYIKLMIVAMLIAAPLAWWLMQQWLNTFSYHVAINPWIFVLAGVVQLFFALLCVGYLALRAASQDPAVVLKEE